MQGGFRLYSPADIERIERIKQLKELLGFSLSEIAEMLDAEELAAGAAGRHASPAEDGCRADTARDGLRRQLDLIDQKMAGMAQLREQIAARLSQYDGNEGGRTVIRLSNRHLLFGVVSLALLTSSMQFSMVSVAIPDLIGDLNAPLGWVGWVVTMYTLMQAVSMPIAGKLSDELGRRTVFVGGLTGFAIASLVCALAPNIWVLIFGRAIQGLAGGSLLPSAYGIVGEAFPEQSHPVAGVDFIGLPNRVHPRAESWRRDRRLGRLALDVRTERAARACSWSVIALFLMGPSIRRETSRIDFVGAGLMAVSVTSLVYALTEWESKPVIQTSSWWLRVSSSPRLATIWLLRYEQRCSSPIIDLALLRRREFAFVNTLNFFYGVAVFGVFSFIPLFASSAYGMGSGETGRLLTPRAMVMMVVSSARAWRYRVPAIASPLSVGSS